ncbi:hypothetical protein NUBL17186_17490 [Klebsiella quasipneumoniae]|nr:hypothetical protein NUBL17186_17490 [Klebsiella quasipneumoniae]
MPYRLRIKLQAKLHKIATLRKVTMCEVKDYHETLEKNTPRFLSLNNNLIEKRYFLLRIN